MPVGDGFAGSPSGRSCRSKSTLVVQVSPLAARGEFRAPLAAASHGPEALRNVLKRPGTVDNFLQVDGPAQGLSAFRHGDAARVLQHTG